MVDQPRKQLHRNILESQCWPMEKFQNKQPLINLHERCNGFEYVGMTVRTVPFTMFSAPHIVELPVDIAKDYQVE